MSVRKPSLELSLRALRQFPIDPAGDLELADALELTAQVHQSTQANADRGGHYGTCTGCDLVWPCPTWVGASYTVTEWLVTATNLLMRRSGRLGPALPVGSPEPGLRYRSMQEVAA